MTTTAGQWRFSYRDIEMNDKDLEEYQHKLLDIRSKYAEKVKNLTDCGFYSGEQSPEDNIFAYFPYECKRHHPSCTGWYLLWNPNIPLNKEKLHSSLHNHCTLWQYKSVSKKIQLEIEKYFENYFEFFDDDDTHPYYIDQFYNLRYGFKADEDELPDYTSFGLEETHSNITEPSNPYA